MPAAAEGAVVPDRTVDIDGRRVHVFDGLIADAGEYEQALGKAFFTRTEIARPDTAGYRHWVTETRLDALARQPILAATQRAIAAGSPAAYRPYRAYTNVASYGDVLFTHVDCLPGANELTALWFMCGRWDIEWGGETVFFDASDEIAFAVLPRPGRLVVFDGAIKHVGRPPSRVCFAPRYTFAIKFERVAAA